MTMFERCEQCHLATSLETRLKMYEDMNTCEIASCQQCCQEFDRWRINGKFRRDKYKTVSFLTFEQWRKTLAFFDYRCAVCGATENEFVRLAPDHWYPISLGGHDTWDNIIPLCARRDSAPKSVVGCNDSKSNKYPREWLIERCGTHGDFIFGYIEGLLLSIRDNELIKAVDSFKANYSMFREAQKAIDHYLKYVDVILKNKKTGVNYLFKRLDRQIKELDKISTNKERQSLYSMALGQNSNLAYTGGGGVKIWTEINNNCLLSGLFLMTLIKQMGIAKEWGKFTLEQKRIVRECSSKFAAMYVSNDPYEAVDIYFETLNLLDRCGVVNLPAELLNIKHSEVGSIFANTGFWEEFLNSRRSSHDEYIKVVRNHFLTADEE